MERIPMKEGTVIRVNNTNIMIKDFSGEGSTCLVYTGKIMEDMAGLSDTLVTVKEFYPQSDKSLFDIERDEDGQLHVSEITKDFMEYKSRLEQFEAGYSMQKELANSEAMEITVKPHLYGSFGDSFYIISDIHMGTSLERIPFESLSDKLSCIIRIAEMLGILHKSGYMMMDFKPDNLLWISNPKTVKLLDVDSIISIGNSEGVSDELLKEDTLYINTRYCAPEVLLLKRMVESGKTMISDKKEAYLKPRANVYSIGFYLFELLFDRIPSDDDKLFGTTLRKELFMKYKEDFKNEATAGFLFDVLKKSMQPHRRFVNAYDLMNALNVALEKITFQKYVPKRTIAKANYTYLSYNMIEKYPLYDYARKEGTTTVMDVAIIGTHGLRESLLKVLIPCGQMLDSKLNIRMFSEDAKTFWDAFSSESGNPELRRSVQLFVDGQEWDNREEIEQAELVKEPLATIYLYTDKSPENRIKILKEQKVSYIIHMEKNADEFVKRLPKRKTFVAYLKEENTTDFEVHEKIDVFAVSTEKSSEGYDESIYKSRIYNMGMSVHEYYYRGNHPRATVAEIKESFAKDHYNIESSERCALHTNYKLKSIGIDPKSQKAPYLFYEKVLGAKTGEAQELFDKIVALEHRSWTAFMILNGVRGVDDMKTMFASYAYEGKNDWKKKNSEGQVICHPCLKYSEPGRKLNATVWSTYHNMTKTKWNTFDPLDRRSMEICDAVDKIAEERKEAVFARMNELGNTFMESESEVAVDAYHNLVYSAEKVYAGETNSENLWRQAIEELKSIGENENLLGTSTLETLHTIEYLMKPALWTIDNHDFKHSDEDTVRVIPKLLLQNTQDRNSKVTIVKPVTKNAWQNLFSTLIVNPDLLVLVPMNGEEEKAFENYSLWLKSCHVDTTVWVKSLKQLREYGGKDSHIFIDETGVEPEHSRMLMKNPYMKSAHTFKVENRMLKSTDGNTLITLFNRPMNLTVQETLMLHGTTMISEKMPDYIGRLSVLEYKAIWNLYRELKDGRKWKIFIKELENSEENKNRKIKLDDRSNPGRYESAYLEYDILKRSGIEKVLEKLKKQDVLVKYSIPAVNQYGKVSITCNYKKLAEELIRILSMLAQEVSFHSFDVEVKKETVYFYDNSLYVKGNVPHIVSKEVTTDAMYRDTVLKEAFELLNNKNKDKVLQNIQFDDATGQFSFRYASDAVREVLRKEGSILEALIYLECKKNAIFDDIRANVEFVWPDKKTKNEIDIIGTKNSKTFFVSAKMQIPDKMHVYEIKTLCDQFAIEGEAILVSSHYTTGTHETKGTAFDNRPIALEDRVQDMEHITYIGKDGVDYVDAESQNRRFVIASSIGECIKDENR